MHELIGTFFSIVDEFRKKPYDLLDYTKNQFDRDYLEFNVSIHELETALQGFINSSFENIELTPAVIHSGPGQLKRSLHDAAWSGPSTPAVMSPGTRMW